ncbi:hypothetical protein D3C72_1016480 [compost metagenome]
MVEAAAARDGVLLQRAQARRGLAAVDQACLGMGDCRGIGRGVIRDAAQALHDVQRGALGSQHAACVAAHVEQHGAFFHLVAIGDAHIQGQRRVVAGEDARGDVDAGDQHGLAGIHAERAGFTWLDHRMDRQVADANVLGQPEIDQFVGGKDVIHGKRS